MQTERVLHALLGPVHEHLLELGERRRGGNGGADTYLYTCTYTNHLLHGNC